MRPTSDWLGRRRDGRLGLQRGVLARAPPRARARTCAGSHSESNTSIMASTSAPRSSAPTSLPAQRTATCPGPVTWTIGSYVQLGTRLRPPQVGASQAGPECARPQMRSLPVVGVRADQRRLERRRRAQAGAARRRSAARLRSKRRRSTPWLGAPARGERSAGVSSRRNRVGRASSEVIEAWKATESASRQELVRDRERLPAGQCSADVAGEVGRVVISRRHAPEHASNPRCGPLSNGLSENHPSTGPQLGRAGRAPLPFPYPSCSANAAPCGSSQTATRAPFGSVSGSSTRPPAARTAATAGSSAPTRK